MKCAWNVPSTHNCFVSNRNSIGIVDVAVLILAEKTLPNCQNPNVLVDIVTLNRASVMLV